MQRVGPEADNQRSHGAERIGCPSGLDGQNGGREHGLTATEVIAPAPAPRRGPEGFQPVGKLACCEQQ